MTFEHMKEVSEVARPEHSAENNKDDEHREPEVKVLREIVERELQGRTVAVVANDMVRFWRDV